MQIASPEELNGMLALPGRHADFKQPGSVGKGTHIVVDMQPGFAEASANPWTIAVNEYLLKRAVEEGRAVVVLENTPKLKGHTFPRLLRVLEGYRRAVVVSKYDDDGSKQVIETCQRYGFDDSQFEGSGVHTDACVLATLNGVATLRPHSCVRAIREGCWSNTPCGMWSDFSRVPNVSIASMQDLPARLRSLGAPKWRF